MTGSTIQQSLKIWFTHSPALQGRAVMPECLECIPPTGYVTNTDIRHAGI